MEPNRPDRSGAARGQDTAAQPPEPPRTRRRQTRAGNGPEQPQGEPPRQRRRTALGLGPPNLPNVFRRANEGLPALPAAAAVQAAPNVAIVASYSDDGEIGSFYFPGYRIRSTHWDGAGVPEMPNANIMRFNVDRSVALLSFLEAPEGQAFLRDETEPTNTRQQERKFIAAMEDARDAWIATQLQASAEYSEPPEWAVAIRGPEDVQSFDTLSDPERAVMFEVLPHEQSDMVLYHRSRGTAAQLTLSQSDIDALRGALVAIRGEGSRHGRNQLFYDHLTQHAPHLAARMRRPSQV